MDWRQPAIRDLIQLALAEDCVRADITSGLVLQSARPAKAEIVAREPLLVCGLPLVDAVFAELAWPAASEHLSAEGQRAESGQVLARLSADIKHLLAAERVILNFLQRMCGVATFTRKHVEQAHGLALYDTRKTTPGWRALEKYAVQVGGGRNQRAHLADGILVKNNHLDALLGAKPWKQQDLIEALRRIARENVQGLSLQVEVRDRFELESVLEAPVEKVLLDNMTEQQIAQCMRLVRSKKPGMFVEVSGQVTIERLEQLSALGVSAASLGAFTRKADWADISMRVLR